MAYSWSTLAGRESIHLRHGVPAPTVSEKIAITNNEGSPRAGGLNIFFMSHIRFDYSARRIHPGYIGDVLQITRQHP